MDGDAAAGGPHIGQFECRRLPALREEPPAAAQVDRVDEQVDLVDQAVRQEALRERATAVDLELALRRLLLQPCDPGGDIAGDHGGVLPRRVGQGGGDDVLGQRVEAGGDRIERVGDLGPVGREDVIRTPSEEVGARPVEDLVHEGPHVLVREGRQPAAVRESTRGVLVGAPGACITPSRDTNVVRVSFAMVLLLRLAAVGCGSPYASTCPDPLSAGIHHHARRVPPSHHRTVTDQGHRLYSARIFDTWSPCAPHPPFPPGCPYWPPRPSR